MPFGKSANCKWRANESMEMDKRIRGVVGGNWQLAELEAEGIGAK